MRFKAEQFLGVYSMSRKTSQKSIQFSLLALSAVALLGACGSKPSETAAELLSTDQRPDISDDRQTVHITVGTKDHINIRSRDLRALVKNVPHSPDGKTQTQLLTGQYISAVAQNEKTTIVAVAVNGMTFTETDFSMVFLVNPANPDKPKLVKFEMPGKKNQKDNSTQPFRTVRELIFDSSGLLHLQHADASGSRAEIIINQDATIRSCRYIVKDEGSLCGEQH